MQPMGDTSFRFFPRDSYTNKISFYLPQLSLDSMSHVYESLNA